MVEHPNPLGFFLQLVAGVFSGSAPSPGPPKEAWLEAGQGVKWECPEPSPRCFHGVAAQVFPASKGEMESAALTTSAGHKFTHPKPHYRIRPVYFVHGV